MSEITRGKWDWRFRNGQDSFNGIELTCDGEKMNVSQADLKIICAAPEMYDLLKEYLFTFCNRCRDFKLKVSAFLEELGLQDEAEIMNEVLEKRGKIKHE